MSPADGGQIILVVHHPGNAKVLAEAVSEAGMTAVHADSTSTLTECLTNTEPPRAALVDVSGFGQDVWTLCNQLHERGIPFVVMSTAQDQMASSRSLECGAASVLHKPVAKEALLKLLESIGGQ